MSRKIHGVKVRGLTRKEVKSLKEFGFYLSFYSPPIEDPAKVDEGVEKALELCVLDKAAFELLEEQEHNKSTQVFSGICRETYGARDEEKNLPASGNGSQTDSE